ncbi:MAG: peptidoglycan editing factor PgeF [Ramlibacter sp.]
MSHALPSDWIEPVWPAAGSVRAACSVRSGGVSSGPYASLNLGQHVRDDPALVARNRRHFAAALAARPVFLNQVHGRGVIRLEQDSLDGVDADACWTTQRAIACTIMVADCLPVLLADAQGRAVGAAHCGWRGLAGGVLESLWTAMRSGVDGGGAGAVAWLGPCIGPDAFEVGLEVRDAFVATDPGAAACFRPLPQDKLLGDLPALARRRLQALGVASIGGNDGSTPWCTVANPSRFFSHRRDRLSGRFAAACWLG